MIKIIRTIAIGITFAAIFAVSIHAQVPVATQAQPGRVYVINPQAFGDEKAGITKYVAGLAVVNGCFYTEQNQIIAVAQRIQTLGTELKGAANTPETRAKADEYERLQRELKFKQEDTRARYAKREAEVMGPIRQQIGVALQEFAKKNGYWMILDASKIDEVGGFLTIDDAADVTKAFIIYFNGRPAGAK